METRVDNFGIYLKDHRERKGWTQRELAERLGVTNTHVSHVEAGRQKPTDNLINGAIAVLGLDSYEACWIARRLPGRIEELLLEAGPDEWRQLEEKYGRS